MSPAPRRWSETENSWLPPRPLQSTETKQNTGRIEEIQGVVIEAVFPDELPEINSAITIDRGDEGILVCEVQQHLGDDRVRAVAMDTTDGLARGAEVVDTGGPITVPVGEVTLGRIFNLLGEVIDEGDPIEVKERWPIHRDAPDGHRPHADDRDVRDRASRSSTCSRPTPRAARSASSAAPASARR